MIAVNQEAVLAGIHFGLANFHLVAERKIGGHWLGENRYGNGEGAEEDEIRQEGFAFHLSKFPFHVRVNRKLVAWSQELTHWGDRSSLADETPLCPGSRAGTPACHWPRGYHRGVFNF